MELWIQSVPETETLRRLFKDARGFAAVSYFLDYPLDVSSCLEHVYVPGVRSGLGPRAREPLFGVWQSAAQNLQP